MSSSRSKLLSIIGALPWVAVFLVAGYVIGNMTRGEIPGWYEGLTKPAVNPPNYLFGIVWSILYVFIGIVGYRIWRGRKRTDGKILLGLFFFQTFLNWVWSYLFFYFHMLGFSSVWLAILVLTVAAMTFLLGRSDRISFTLFLPYLVWICFALYLNSMIWSLNT